MGWKRLNNRVKCICPEAPGSRYRYSVLVIDWELVIPMHHAYRCIEFTIDKAHISYHKTYCDTRAETRIYGFSINLTNLWCSVEKHRNCDANFMLRLATIPTNVTENIETNRTWMPLKSENCPKCSISFKKWTVWDKTDLCLKSDTSSESQWSRGTLRAFVNITFITEDCRLTYRSLPILELTTSTWHEVGLPLKPLNIDRNDDQLRDHRRELNRAIFHYHSNCNVLPSPFHAYESSTTGAPKEN
jgi:hypothetical protein